MALVEDEKDRLQFLPQNIIQEILTESTVRSLLLEKEETSHIHPRVIVGDTKRIKLLSILILMKRTKHLRRMILPDVWDKSLPLTKESLQNIFPTVQDNSSFVERFFFDQSLVAVPAWDFTSPDLEEMHSSFRYHNMPFLKTHKLSNGGQGLIWKVEIHPAHFTGTRTGSVCLYIQRRVADLRN